MHAYSTTSKGGGASGYGCFKERPLRDDRGHRGGVAAQPGTTARIRDDSVRPRAAREEVDQRDLTKFARSILAASRMT